MLSLDVELTEVDGNILPKKTIERLLKLLKKENKEEIGVNLIFPRRSNIAGDREGILGWYRPRTYKINNEIIGFSKINFLQEILNYEGNYHVEAKHHGGTDYIELNIQKIN